MKKESMKILMTGATGMIGKQIGKKLVRDGHQVFIVARDPKKAEKDVPYPCTVIQGDLGKEVLHDLRLNDMEAVIHLAGENVGDSRWTEEKKKRIHDSRVKGTTHLLQSLQGAHNLKVIVGASAIGYYGDRGDEILTETSEVGKDFLAGVCEEWEKPYRGREPQVRTVLFRTGVVLSGFDGAFLKMLAPFQWGIGGALGDGKQWMSWIHLDDIVALYCEAIQNEKWAGIYNAVSPDPVTNQEFTAAMAKTMKTRVAPAAPKLAIKTLVGEMSTLVLSSQRVKNERLMQEKFHYKYPRLDQALKDCCQYYQNGDSLFYTEQFLPVPLSKVFPFFASADNLEKITPESLNFKIKKKSSEDIHEGTLIDYDLKIHGVPVGWQTKIEKWQPPQKFIDTQLKGPYKKWEHTHEFEELGGGTLMRDIVRYQLPVGVLGKAVAGKWVEGDVHKIFAYRREAVPKLIQK